MKSCVFHVIHKLHLFDCDWMDSIISHWYVGPMSGAYCYDLIGASHIQEVVVGGGVLGERLRVLAISS
jgi:hypothetical protein